MTHPITIARVSLHPSKSLDIRNGHGTNVRVVEGVVWITQAGDPQDVVLAAGQSFVVDRDGLTLVSALGAPAVITIIPEQAVRFDTVPEIDVRHRLLIGAGEVGARV